MDSSPKNKPVNPTEFDPNKISYYLKKDLEGDKRMYNSIIRYAEKNLFVQTADAEDLVADVYTHLIDIGNKGHVLKASESNKALLSFLYTCVRTNQKSNLRRLKRKKDAFEGFYKTIREEDLYESCPEIELIEEEQSKKISEAVNSLSKIHRTPLELILNGCSYR